MSISDENAIEADLVFAPTLACWKFCSGFTVTPLLSETYPRQDLLLSRTMLHSTFGCITWVLLPATGMDFQPQTFYCSLIISDSGKNKSLYGVRVVISTASFHHLRGVIQ
jgi:hypothetical protein